MDKSIPITLIAPAFKNILTIAIAADKIMHTEPITICEVLVLNIVVDEKLSVLDMVL